MSDFEKPTPPEKISAGSSPDLAAREKLDSRWYPRLLEALPAETYKYLDGTREHREAQRDLFWRGEIRNPELDYPHLDVARFQEMEAKLFVLREEMDAQGPDSDTRQLWHWRINEEIARLRLLEAAANKDWRAFRHYNHLAYGEPSAGIFAWVVQHTREGLIADQQSDNTELRCAAGDLLTALPTKLPETEPISLEVPDDLLQVAREQTQKEFPFIFTIPEGEGRGPWDSQKLAPFFDQVVAELAVKHWQTAVNPNRRGLNADQKTKTVEIGEKGLPIERPFQLAKSAIHEVATHPLKRENGEDSILMLLGIGLDRYEAAEEGIASMRESTIFKEETDDYGAYLALSLAAGLDGHPRDFRDVYTIVEKYNRYIRTKRGQDVSKAPEAAYEICTRVFRGTDCRTPGIYFHKDIIYRLGQVEIWKMVRDRPAMLRVLSIGKFDPTNKRHLAAMVRLGILDKDLEKP